MENKLLLLRNRVDLYKDFAINLLHTMDKYYLGRDALITEEDIRNHYEFCYNKVCDGFKDEELYFHDNKELKEYYFNYYYYEYYTTKTDIDFKEFDKFFKTIFNIESPKNKAYLDALLEIYELSEKTINNINNEKKLVS